MDEKHISKLISNLGTDIIRNILYYLDDTAAIIYLTIIRRYCKNIIPPNYTLVIRSGSLINRVFTLTNLRRLHLFNNHNILCIDRLINLTTLIVTQDETIPINIVKKIGKLTQLQKLTLSRLPFEESLQYLCNLTNLTHLNIIDARFLCGNELSHLVKLVNLTSLCVPHIELDVFNLNIFPHLTELDLSCCYIRPRVLAGISYQTTLTRLTLDNTIHLSNLDFITPLIRLNYLSLIGTNIKDKDLSALVNLSLTTLDLTNCTSLTKDSL